MVLVLSMRQNMQFIWREVKEWSMHDENCDGKARQMRWNLTKSCKLFGWHAKNGPNLPSRSMKTVAELVWVELSWIELSWVWIEWLVPSLGGQAQLRFRFWHEWLSILGMAWASLIGQLSYTGLGWPPYDGWVGAWTSVAAAWAGHFQKTNITWWIKSVKSRKYLCE